MKGRFNVATGRFLLLTTFALAGLAGSSEAQVATLTDANSVVQVNTSAQQGMFNWSVDGVNQLFQQQFWYRIGPAGPEASINTLSAPSFTTTPDSLFLTYNNVALGLSVEVDYNLVGGTAGSGQSGMTESVTLKNNSANAMELHFFQYADFDLGGTAGGQTVTLTKNLSGLFNDAFQTGGGSSVSESSVVPGANHGEAGIFPATINKLNDGLPTTLNDNATAGPADVTWAMQWDYGSIATGSSKLISKTLAIGTVPEPGVLALVSLGLVAFGVSRRKRAA